MNPSPSNLPLVKRTLLALNDLQSRLAELEQSKHEPIAIIGLGCRFPQAENPDAFWNLLQTGTDAITEVPTSRWDLDAYYDPNPDAPGKIYSRCGGFLDQVDTFDPQFFNISAREARSLDPQQRLLLEVSWEALEHANQVSDRLFQTPVGVFVGITTSDYALRSLKQQDVPIDAYFGTGNALSVAAGRLSYTLGLAGPSLAVDTACSSSLVAVHLACQSLRQGECRMALAGGVNLLLSPENSISISKARMLSVDGRCKTFDAKADGYVRGEGCGVVILKRLRDAIADGDTILATIRGSAVNQDGPSGGLTVPNGPAQQSVIRQALAQAKIEPHQVQYVEAHGTGTALGDPIELQALGAVYGEGRSADTPLIVGSVKTNIGHLEPAAGISGLIKLVLSLTHAEIPAHLHFQQPSPHIPWAELPIAIPTCNLPWAVGDQPRFAGLSSFGFSGTNAHLIVEEAPLLAPIAPDSVDRPLHLLTLSGKSEIALQQLAQRYVNHLATDAEVVLSDLCFTANVYRSHFKHRLALTAQNHQTLRTDLIQFAQGQPSERNTQSDQPIRGAIAFLFTGQGSQYPGMGQQLYETQPFFRDSLTRCAEILAPLLDIPLLELLYPELYPGRSPDSIHQTRYTQPAIFALEYALAQLWQSWGIRPTAVMGHSLGEYVAACVAGVFSLEDGLKLIVHRAQLMQALPPNGAMVAVLADEATVAQAIAPYATQVSIAAFNGSRSLVISGVEQAVNQVVQTLSQQGISTKRLPVSHAFHSALMEPMLDDFERVAQEITYYSPRLNLISNLTGTLAETEITTVGYWVRHIRQPVQFTHGITTLIEQGYGVFLEIGARSMLLGIARIIAQAVPPDREPPDRLWLASLHSDEDNWQTMLSSLRQLFVRGVEIDWLSFDQPYARRRLSGLPTYPFQRQRYWIAEGVPAKAPGKLSVLAPIIAPMPLAAPQSCDRRSQILALLQEQVGNSLVGEGMRADPQASFLELGADSINLFETIQIVDKAFGIEVTVRQFFEELSTLDALAAYIDQSLPIDSSAVTSTLAAVSNVLPSASQNFNEVFVKVDQLQHHLAASEAETPLVRVIQDQLAVLQTVMTQQLSALQNETFSRAGGYSAPVQTEIFSHPKYSTENRNGDRTNKQRSPNQTSHAEAAIGSLSIPKADRTQPLPLSFAQQRLWFLNQLEGASAAYNLPFALRLIGQIKISALEQAFETLCDRHESLRTTFCRSAAQAAAQEDAQDVQIIHPPAAIPIEQVDLRGLDAIAQAQAVHHHSQQEAQHAFDLETGPLLRVVLLRLKSDEQILLVTMHHIVSDGWSMTVFAKEVLFLYQLHANEQPMRMPPLLTQYADYAVWQHQWLQGAVLQEKLDYWQQQLAGTLPVVELPADRPRPAVRSGQGQTLRWRISEALTQDLQRLSQQEGVTLFMLLLAAFKTLLHRYTGQTDILVGTPIANRNQADVKGLIGFFVNTLVLRTDLSGEPSFRSLLSRVREVTLDAYAHQELPFEKLVEALQPERSLSHTPLFQVMFVLQNVPMQTLKLPGLQVEQIEVESGAAQFDLTLELTETEQGLQAALSYSTDLFEAATIARLQGHFQSLLESVISSPTQSLTQLAILPIAERQQIVYEWNNTAVDFADAFLLHAGFEAQALRSPEAIALLYEEQTLTYQQLNDRANQLAHLLHQLGITTDILVGVYAERSPEMVIAVLAILKAGGAYVPLDPTYPADRIADTIADAQMPLILSQSHLLEKLPPHPAQVLCLDQPIAATYATTNLDRDLSPDQLAYVIYTSGSTGKPKGVMISHRGAVNTNLDINYRFAIQPCDRVIALASLSFDLSVYDLFGFLAAGAAIVLPHAQEALNPTRWLQLMHQHQVTFWNTAPAVMEMLMASVTRQAQRLPDSLRVVMMSGDVISVTLPDQIRSLASPAIQVYSFGGATEGSIWSICHAIDRVEPEWTSIPYGKPIANQRFHILDAQLNPVPVGVAGELHIGGTGVALGYFRRPELSAARFIADPFFDEPNARLYKTGDRGRYLADGTIQFLGRMDYQVKIRGFRIELGEIEAAVTQYAGVREAAILVREDVPGSKLLCAYVVAQPGEAIEVAGLRQALRQKLPDYMVPSFILLLDVLPLTANGKVDRKALPMPQSEDLSGQNPYVAPRNSIESTLVDIWSDLLGISPISIADSFFELGGHSLLAMQVLSRVRQEFQVELALAELFRDPTILHLAQLVAQAAQGSALSFPDIPLVDRNQPLSLSVSQQRIWLLEKMEALSAAYHVAIRQEIHGRLDVAVLNQCLQVLMARHEVLRTTFHLEGDRPVQVIHPTLPLRVEFRESADLPSELSIFAKDYARQPFDLEADPLIRVMLVQISPNRQTLLLVIHHIIADAWSLGILMQEMMALYPALEQGLEPQLPELPIQAVDFAQWQHQWLQGEVLQQQLNYWQQQLTGAPTVLNLPTDRPRPAAQTFNGAVLSIPMPADLTQSLNRLSQQAGVSLYMTLLAAFGILLHRYSGQPEVLIGSPIANRSHPQIQGLMGLFLNTLVLRLNCADRPFRDYLQQVQTVALEAYTHQDVPFEQLLEKLPTERNRGYSPWFQVMFILQNAHRYQFDLPNVQTEASLIDLEVAKFDLTLSMEETEAGLVGEWEYNCDLFDATTIARMAAQFQQLLEAIAQDSQQSLAQLSLLPITEQRLLTQFAQTDSPSLLPLQPVHQWIETQAERTPAAIALESQGATWTYQTLNEKANQIAQALRSQGITANNLVGVCLERSPELIATLLGILKAGATYVPMDSTYPPERLHQMLEDAQVGALVTRSDLQTRLRLTAPVVLDLSDSQIMQYSSANLDLPIDLAQIAYIIYTSGSTGKPKGTRLTHRGLSNFVQQAIAQYGFTAGDRVLQFASISFDAAVEEIYSTLCSGGTLVLRSDEMLASGTAFCQASAVQHLTIWDLPTAFWHRLTQDLAQGIAQLPVNLRLVIIGGERVLPQMIQLWQQVTQDSVIRLLNTYGPTEATVVATTYDITAQTSSDAEVPIGKPLGNVQVYVLDQALQQVPIGVPGELYLGGYGLAEGYLNRPDLTAERFIPHPFRDNERLYKTGDRVRFLPTGNLVYLGRTDDQVKIRGFRVELGEVERLVQQHPDIRECAVIAQPDSQGINQLIAYVIAATAPTSQALRQFLQAQVPDYLVPALFIPVEAIPLTPAGKLDRRSLPQPQAADWATPNAYVAPRTPTEAALTFMVAEVLGQERVGIHDDFFSLGGHSLSAMQILARIRTMFQREVSLRSLFEEPTVAALAAELERSDSPESGAEAIDRLDRSQPLPLSFAQQRLWFLNQLEGASATYNLPFALRLKGRVNVAAVEQCLAAIVERHEVLRTTFAQSGDRGIQIVHPPSRQAIALVDLSEDQEDQAMQQQIAAAAQYAFDLQAESLLRVTLLRLDPEEHILLVTMHHIVSDAWSIGLFVREIMELYPAFCQGQVPQVKSLPIQYADYAVWQQQQQQRETFQQRLNAWVRQFADAPPLLELPTDRPRPAIQSFRGGIIRVELPAALTQQLKTLSQQQQKTLFMTLLAAFVTLMHRYSRQSDLVVGIPIAGRTHPQLESLIGFFINTLPLRFNLEANPAFAALLEQVQSNTLEAYTQQDIPFEKLLERLPLARDLSYLPLCQVMFILQNAPTEELQLPGLTLEPLPTHSGVSRFDLTLSMTERGDRLFGEWEYNSDLFEEATIERMAAQFTVLLQSITANPQQPISRLALLTQAERQTLLTDWNQTQIVYPQDRCIHQLIAAQAERTPDAIAVRCVDRNLTYRQLDQQANQLAHHLQAQGVRANSLVGLCVDRSSWMLIGLLGILKAGAAYIPLDPAFPAERLAWMVEDAQLALLLTQMHLPGIPNSPVTVCLDAAWSQIVQQPTGAPESSAKPTDTAYVIYTSGSTGRPKGVQVSHRNVVNFLGSMSQAPGLTAADTLLSVTTLSFDIAVLELFLPLTLGACVVVASREVAVDGDRLCQLLNDSGATVMQATPSTWRMLLDAGWQGNSNLKILCGGEALPPQLAHQLSRRCAALWNLYGPTETTVWSLLDRVSAEAGQVLIGRPIANTQAYVLDADLQPVPIGVPGELLIGGDGVTQGYLNQPGLTAERFMPNPFSGRGDRLYRTGDLVRYRADGRLEYLGRLDHQVKLRGFRIELGEIESVLRRHPGVREAIAIVRQSETGIQTLVAYVVAQEQSLAAQSLQQFTKDRLPQYMVPAAFVILEALPLTPNGKVDRKALPAPQSEDLRSQGHYVAPRTELEAELAQLWADLLGIASVGVEDNFFELGGHSLAAMQLVSRIRTRFHQDVSLRSLFEAPTIAALAAQLQTGTELDPAETLAIARVDRSQPIPLSSGQQRLWFLSQLEGNSATYNMPIALRLQGALNHTALEQCFAAIVDRHEVLRTNFAQVDGEAIQVIHPHLSVPILLIDFTASQSDAIAQQVEAESQYCFDLQTGALLRVSLLRLSEQEHVLLLILHHVISDAWSLGLFVQEIMTLYPAFCEGRSPQVTPLPIQYADYAVWQRQQQQTESFQERLVARAQQFVDAPPLLELPTDRPRPAAQSFRGGLVQLELPSSLSEQLKSFSQQQQKTLFMTLLAAFVALMHRYSRQTDLVIGTPIAGRNHPDLEALMGLFINTLPLRFSLEADRSYAALLEQVQSIALDAFAQQDIPFEKVLERLPLSRDLSYLPLCQVMFVLQNAPMEELRIPGLTLEPVFAHSGVSRFDLTLFMTERGDRIVGEWEYNSDLFDAATIERMAAQFTILLQSIMANPQQSIATLPLLTPAQSHTLLTDWNQTQVELPQHCIHQGIEAQAQRTPEAIAIRCVDRILTYRELDEQANQLAHYLQIQGIGANALIGLSVDRTSWMLIGLLSILKAGAAYVPLDPAFPADRLALMVTDAQLSLVITQAHLADQLPISDALCIDAQWDAIAQQPITPIANAVQLSQLAYVIYTSGSTGRPKGVQVTHQNVTNFLHAMQQRPGIRSTDIVLSVTTLSFDIAVLELFLPLSVGASVVVASQEVARDGDRLSQLLTESGATLMQATPSTWRMLLDAGWQGNPNLTILCGGEALSSQLAQALSDRCAALWNLYGPTETTVWSLCDRVDLTQEITIGTPIANTQVYVLGTDLQPLPVGVPGELLIGGAGVTPGYLHQPELTSDRFIPDPFSADPTAKLYRTGDLVRYRADGRLDYLGRIDFQVKLRGFRIELGEIESVLLQHPGVTAAVAIVRQSGESQQLVAYVMANEAIETAELQQQAREFLPHYMIPAAFVMLDALPLTPNGKVDRKALPAPQGDDFQTQTGYVAPRTEVESRLVELWSELLGISPIGIESNFFELGGHSLLATQLVAQVRQRFNVELSLRALFEQPTIARLSTLLASGSAALTAPLPMLEPNPGDRHIPFDLNEVQRAYWIGRTDLFDLGNVSTHVYLEFDCWQMNLAQLNQAFQRVIERHDMLRAIVLPNGEQQILAEVPAYEIQTIDLSGLDAASQGTELAAIRTEMAHQVLPADRYPLFEVRAARLSQDQIKLYVSSDALLVDAWSMQLIAAEWLSLYRQPQQVLPALTLSFRDYVLAEQQLRTHDRYQRDQHYWFDRLDTLPLAPELPLAIQPSRIEQPRFERRSDRLEAIEWQALQQRGAKAGLTPSGLLLTAFAEVLAQWSRRAHFTLNLTLFNRLPLHPEINEIVGDFTSLNLLEVDLRDSSSFTQQAKRLQQQLFDDLDHRLVSGLQVLRELNRRQGGLDQIFMPIVFTSTLGMPTGDPNETAAFGELVYSLTQTPQVWLDHQVFEQAGALVFNWDAVEELFPAGLLDDLFSTYVDRLHQLAAIDEAWTQPRLTLLPPEQQAQREQINQTAVPLSDALLHELFIEQVLNQPNALAVITSVKTLTYGQVYQRANYLGHWLRQQGVKPNTLVAVLLEKGWEQVVAVLGILMAGAAYVPIDPHLPLQRRQQLLELTEAQIVVTTSQILEDWTERLPLRYLFADQEPAQDLLRLETVQQPTDLAYVIYTSGSTGMPKGVAIDHCGAVNTILDINQRFGVGSQDRVLALSALNFDLSVYDIFGLLAAGGAIVIPDADQRNEPSHWLALMLNHQVTVWNTVPALGQVLANSTCQKLAADIPLRLVLLSGDWLPLGLPAQLCQNWSSLAVISLGGATEASIWSIYYPIAEVDPAWSSIPYGLPLGNQLMQVLNPKLEPCPTWVAGDLYIGGMGLAQGYWRDPDKTQASFIIHPVTQERLYRTGDLGRYLPEGAIEFLGREDFQVKLRGFRIELGEIEALLNQHPAVQTAAVILREDRPGDRRLVAYVMFYPSQNVESLELRLYLQQMLPEYMVPAAFVPLSELPLTANGKIDRKGFPILPEDESRHQIEYVAPRNETEAQLVEIWSALLGIAPIGVESHFFELGGNSLSAMQVLARIRMTFNKDISLRSLFESPTIAALAAQLQTTVALEALAIPPVDRTQPLVLSFTQQRLWFLSQLEGASATYNLPIALRLQGEVNIGAMEQCLGAIVSRHEALRTRFVQTEQGAAQVIDPVTPISLQVLDFSHLDASDRAQAVEQQVRVEAQYPFDLANESLLRVQLIRRASDEHVLLVNLHHIISDAWSIGVLVREILAFYPAYCQGQTPRLEALPIQYADYAAWQRQQQTAESFTQRLKSWAKTWLDAPPLLELPTDFTRPAIQSFRGGLVQAELPAMLTQQLKSLSQQRQKTLFMTLMAGFVTLMHRYSRQSDLVIGTPVAGRNHPDLEALIGVFINTLPLRFALDSEISFAALLEQVQTVAIDGFAHQDIPFEKLIGQLPLARDLSYSPLCQVMFILQNTPIEALVLPGLTLEPLPTHSGVSRFDLTLSMTEVDDRFLAEWEYNSDLFEKATIERMAAQFQILLESIVANPQQPLSDIPLLAPSDRQKLLVDWNETQVELPQHCIHQSIEAQAQRTPEAIAAWCVDRILTYRELDEQANQLAHYLQAQGTGTNTLVGLSVDRTSWMLIGLLGILKAGAAYVPLDPAFPADRLALMVTDAQLSLVITQAHLADQLPVRNVLCIDAQWQTIAQQPIAPIANAVQLSQLAYVIYTSGSTGRPKGVQVTHQNVANFLNAMQQRPGIRSTDIVLSVTTLSFDIAVLELFLPLSVGAAVVVASQDVAKDGDRLSQLLTESGATLMQATPSTWRMLLDAGWQGNPNLTILCGGEALSSQLAQALSDRCAALWNLYGPTETTVWSLCDRVDLTQGITIGTPIANTQTYVLGADLQPLPIGVPGELLIGGAGVTPGYLHQPELTSDRFIPDPFSADPTAKLYRTGDLVKYRADERLEYLGRIDFQVKLRGFRIELGEIESVLSQHPAVKAAVAIVRQSGESQQLVAYVVTNGEPIETAELQQQAREFLPHYMIPAAFVMLDALPLTPNGKVDRKALPAPQIDDLRDRKVYLAPRNSIEETLAELWSDLLGVSPIGIADDFFELGGHSLLAMQLLSRVQKHFRVQVQLQPLFEDPTIAQLADLILAEQLQQTDPDLLEQLLAELEELPDEVAL